MPIGIPAVTTTPAMSCYMCYQPEAILSGCKCNALVHIQCLSRAASCVPETYVRCSICHTPYSDDIMFYLAKEFYLNTPSIPSCAHLARQYIKKKEYTDALRILYPYADKISKEKCSLSKALFVTLVATCMYELKLYEKCVLYIDAFAEKLPQQHKLEEEDMKQLRELCSHILSTYGLCLYNMNRYADSMHALKQAMDISELYSTKEGHAQCVKNYRAVLRRCEQSSDICLNQ